MKESGKIIFWVIVDLILWVTAFYLLYYYNTENHARTRTPRYTKATKIIDNKEYNINDYINIETIDIEGYSFKRINLINLDDNITEEFNKKRNMIENEIKESIIQIKEMEYIDYDKITYIDNVFYQINDNILSIYYIIKDINISLICSEEDYMYSFNVDLDNNKILSNEEILKIGNKSIEEIAKLEYYNKLKTIAEYPDEIYYFYDYDSNEITRTEFINNKDELIKGYVNVIDAFLYAYIDKGKITYAIDNDKLDNIYVTTPHGGCSNIIFEED